MKSLVDLSLGEGTVFPKGWQFPAFNEMFQRQNIEKIHLNVKGI